MTWQRALTPQVPGHGSTHLAFTQARVCPQSELTTHSGRQFGAVPMNPLRHGEHTALSRDTMQSLWGPQGDG